MKTKQQLDLRAQRKSLEIHDMMIAMQDELEHQNEGSAADINLDRIVKMVQEVRRMQRELDETLLKLDAHED